MILSLIWVKYLCIKILTQKPIWDELDSQVFCSKYELVLILHLPHCYITYIWLNVDHKISTQELSIKVSFCSSLTVQDLRLCALGINRHYSIHLPPNPSTLQILHHFSSPGEYTKLARSLGGKAFVRSSILFHLCIFRLQHHLLFLFYLLRILHVHVFDIIVGISWCVGYVA